MPDYDILKCITYRYSLLGGVNMSESEILSNEFFKIFACSDGVYVETFKKGFPMDQLSSILLQHPEMAVTSLSALRNAISFAPRKPEKFAEIKERISIVILENEAIATVVFNLLKEELDNSMREKLIKETILCLNQKGIVYGIKKDVLAGEIEPGKPYLIAEGKPAVNGIDAIIKMYELQEASPEVREDGRVDYYELKLINRVRAGDWLGERIEATDGIPGQSIKGAVIRQVKGRTFQLSYDKNSVVEVLGFDKTTLNARINGAVNYNNGKINISNHLEIDGDVGISTGNIKFDGYVTIKGTVSNGFSVEATKDVEINSPFGLGNAKSIVSTGGSIFVKGGISTRDRTDIKAKKSVFIKFIDNATIICGNTAHIGYYCLNSTIYAKEVVLDASNGQIIGGTIKADIRVVAPIIGSEAERKTVVEITGFNRQEMLSNMDSLFHRIGELKSEQQKLKQLIASADISSQKDPIRKKGYNDASDRLFVIRDEIRNLEEERKNTLGYLKTHGEGEVVITKKIHAKSTLIIKGIVMDITEPLLANTFFVQDGELKQL